MRRIVLALAVMATLAFTTTSAQAHPGLFGRHGYGFGQYGYRNNGYLGPVSSGYAAPSYSRYANYGYGYNSGFGRRGVGASFGTYPAYGYGYNNPGLGW